MFFLYSGNQVCRTGNCPTLATGSLSLAFPQLGWLQWARQLASCLPSQVWERAGKSWSAVHQRNTSDSENNLSPLFLSYFRPVVEKETCFIIAHPFQKRDRCATENLFDCHSCVLIVLELPFLLPVTWVKGSQRGLLISRSDNSLWGDTSHM